MGAWERANEAALLAAGNRPEWTRQTAHSGRPIAPSEGVYLGGALRTLVSVSLRRNPSFRTAVITLSGPTGTGFTRVIVNGVTVSTSSNQPIEQVAQGLASAINGHGTVNKAVLAEHGPEPNMVTVTGKTSDDYSIDVMSTTESVSASAEADAVAANAILWGRMGGVGAVPHVWTALRGWEALGVGVSGFTERFDTGGIDRLFVELRHLSGHPDDGAGIVQSAAVWIGPSVLP